MADSRIADLRRRLERDPESRLFAQLAEELRKEGELEEAIGVARAGLARHPAYPSARLTLGRALLDSGDPAAARVELEAAVEGAPENILASRLLGEALETLGDLGSALDQYGRTLQMAPGDGHVEARIRAIQSRLGAPGAGAEDGPEVTAPRKAMGGGADEEDEEGDLPPTIRIRMPGDGAPGGRAPRPPVPRRDPVGETTQPQRPADGGPAGRTEAELAGSELPATLPMPGVEHAARAEEAVQARDPVAEGPAPLMPRDPVPVGDAPEEPAGTGPTGADAVEPAQPTPVEDPEPAPGDDEAVASDLAPTLPRSRAAEFASADSVLPLTLPPGVVTLVDDGADAGDPADSGPVEAEVSAIASDDAARPVSGAESPRLSSATLAELYFEQGLLERAVEVYRQVLEEEPGNQGARERLAEIERLVTEGAAELSVPATEIGDDPAARRRALERTIERLEALLEVVRRR